MVFRPQAFLPALPFDPPDSIPIHEFLFNDRYGRYPLAKSHPAFVDGISGKSFTASQTRDRIEYLARSLAKELDWGPEDNEQSQTRGQKPDQNLLGEKVLCLYTLNTIDTLTVSWAAHRLDGAASPANASYSVGELVYQLKSSGSKALFTCLPLLQIALDAAKQVGLPKERVYLLDLPDALVQAIEKPQGIQTVDKLIESGRSLPSLKELSWSSGQGARQVAFLCYSSGTSGLPKGVMISHRNVIANVLQNDTLDRPYRDYLQKTNGDPRLVVLGLLPYSHIYGLVAVVHSSLYNGDKVVCLPKFEMKSYLTAIQTHKINVLFVVPPIIILMTKNKALCDKFDLGSVTVLWTGAAPLGAETADDVHKLWPNWLLRQGYGMTESCTVVCSTPYDDIDFGSSGCLLPSYEARIVSEEGIDVEEYDQPGELLVKSPSVVLGYLDNDQANQETFQDGWLRTGDKALVRKSPKGNEHIWIVDRMKELIKVKGLQVAPAELEAHLLTHPAVSDAAVIPIPDDHAGEVPKAYVVKAASVGLEDNDRMIIRDIKKHVEKHKAKHKWLQGGVEFIDAIPKSPSGKILRRVLRDKEKDKRRKQGARL